MIPQSRPPRILVTRTDRIGDLVLSTPVFKALREKFPNAWIAGLTSLENREILLGNPYLSEVLLYDKEGGEKNWAGNLRFAARLAQKKFDTVIHLHATNRMHTVTFLAGIPVRIGWDRRMPWALTQAFPEIKKEGLKHEAEYNFDLLKPLGINPPPSMETFFPLNEKARASLKMLLRHHGVRHDRPWMVLSPGASCPSKRWPAERFGILAAKLSARYPDLQFIVIGTAKEENLARKIRDYFPEAFDFSGRLSLAMLGILLKGAALLVSNDSGPVHVAVAVGTPVISIFGRNQPGLSAKRWGPLGQNARVVWKDTGCSPCLAHDCQIHFLCLDAVSVEDVLKEVEYFNALPAGVAS